MRIAKLLPLITASLACYFAVAQKANKWKLVWTEDFKGNRLDTATWNYEVNDQGGGNNELQYYTARDTNVYVKDGLLHIRALEEEYKTRHYTSGRLNTRHKVGFTFGKMECRAKIPTGMGMWPAFWMMSTDEKYGGWPTSGEIDIMETKGQNPDSLWGTAHFGDAWPNNKYKGAQTVRQQPGGFADGFHIYGVEWKKDTISWFVDGKKYFEITSTDVAKVTSKPYPFNEKFYFILDFAVGGGFVGNPKPESLATMPQEFVVDYIKAWQKD